MNKEVNFWHTKSLEDITKELETSDKGLSKDEAKRRLVKYGANQITEKKKAPSILKFLKQFNSPLIYILFIATIISFAFGHIVDGYVILAVVLINASIGFFQERKAEKAIGALKKLIVSYSKVYRNGELVKVLARDLIPGDVIFLEEGDKVPADARLIELKNFRTQDSSLTGESLPQEKSLKSLNEKIALADRTNMVYLGTNVVSGTAKAIVVATGNKTQIGQIAKSIQEIVQPAMHFNEKVKQLTIQVSLFAFIGALITFFVGYFFNKLEFFEIFLFTIAALVSGIPEGLPAVLAIVLAVGSGRMAKRKAVIRHLPAVETLGVVNIIATDKTGTLTQNSMTVEKVITSSKEFNVTGDGWEPLGRFFQGNSKINPLQNPSLKKILSISALCNQGNLLKKDGDYEIVGDPTEIALLVLAKKAGVDKKSLESKEKIIDDLAFSSELKYRVTLVELFENGKRKKQLYSVGAFETILKKCSYVMDNGKAIKLDDKTEKSIMKNAEEMAQDGIRVLGLCYKDVSKGVNKVVNKDAERMVFAGLVGMKDPPRKGVADAIKRAKNAGIRVIMKTGDHKETALAIAKEIGLVEGNPKVLTEEEINEMSYFELKEAVRKFNVYARVTPKTKLKIVQALQDQGEIVAMTGDGVNDAPALKKADIGISMGIIGTDVARESSEVVLTDDNFSSIVNAIEEGRIVFQNIRRASFFLVNTSVAEYVTIISSMALSFPLPLLPIQVLYLNLVTSGVTDVSLAMEPSHGDVLSRPPRNKKEKILNKDMFPFLFMIVSLMVLGTLPLFNHFLSEGLDKARTAAFVSMSMLQLFNVFNMRSLTKSIRKIGFFTNKWVVWGVLVSFSAMLAVIYIPSLATIFSFAPLNLTDFLLITLIASSVFILGEVYKFVKFGRKKGKKLKPNEKD